MVALRPDLKAQLFSGERRVGRQGERGLYRRFRDVPVQGQQDLLGDFLQPLVPQGGLLARHLRELRRVPGSPEGGDGQEQAGNQAIAQGVHRRGSPMR
jgi:hypothetical protein